MSKERLEEINQRIMDMKRKSGMPTEVLTWEGWQSILPIFTKDLEYLQEQAERVQELKETNKKNYWIAADFKFENLQLEQQNKRYREALEIIADKREVDFGNSYTNKAYNHSRKIASKALESEE